MVTDVRQNALDIAAVQEKDEEILADSEEPQEMAVTGALHEAFAKYEERLRDDDPKLETNKRKNGLRKLSAADIHAIVECEKVQLLSHKAIAHMHNISTALVGRVVRAARKNNDYCSQREHNERSENEL